MFNRWDFKFTSDLSVSGLALIALVWLTYKSLAKILKNEASPRNALSATCFTHGNLETEWCIVHVCVCVCGFLLTPLSREIKKAIIASGFSTGYDVPGFRLRFATSTSVPSVRRLRSSHTTVTSLTRSLSEKTMRPGRLSRSSHLVKTRKHNSHWSFQK